MHFCLSRFTHQVNRSNDEVSNNGQLTAKDSQLCALGPWNMLQDDVPTLVVLEALVDDKWEPSDRNFPHLLGDEGKTFCAKNPRRNKRYLQCVLALQDLFHKQLPGLYIGQLQSYYKCILQLEDLSEVVPDKGKDFYLELLDKELVKLEALEDDAESAEALEDVPALPALEDAPEASDDDPPVGRLGPRGPPPAKAKRRARARRRPDTAQDSSWKDALWPSSQMAIQGGECTDCGQNPDEADQLSLMEFGLKYQCNATSHLWIFTMGLWHEKRQSHHQVLNRSLSRTVMMHLWPL